MGVDVFPAFTREEAIEEFRKMWNWMADAEELFRRKVYKVEYFDCHGINPEAVYRQCFLCEYVQGVLAGLNPEEYGNPCDFCPIDFGGEEDTANCYCCCGGSPYDYWEETWSNDWENAAAFARMVAELPEKEVVEC